MTDRFDRNYELIIGSGSSAVVVRPPLRIVFNGDKAINGRGANKLSCKIYNLKESTRLQLVKDAEDSTLIQFQLSVGYGKSIETIFKGNVHVGYNTFESPNHVTSIESLDGGIDFLNSYTSATVKGKTASLNQLMSDMPNIEFGKITALSNISRPKVMVGNTIENLESLLDPDMTWYVDNGQIYIIKDIDVTSRYIPIISASTGLLNTPERQNRIVACETMMNPAIKIGGRVELKSKNAPHLNAVYKVYSISYNGDLEGADWKQSISMIAEEGLTVL